MNSSEKKVLNLALCLLAVGILMRFLPWGLPSIETFQVGDRIIVSVDSTATSLSDSLKIVDKVIESGEEASVPPEGEKSSNKRKIPKKTRKVVSLPLHINVASADELCALNGVGPKLAEKIVAFREASGPFKSAKDLQKVPGIGKKKLESILPGVIFD